MWDNETVKYVLLLAVQQLNKHGAEGTRLVSSSFWNLDVISLGK